jgi:hypothetical protein
MGRPTGPPIHGAAEIGRGRLAACLEAETNARSQGRWTEPNATTSEKTLRKQPGLRNRRSRRRFGSSSRRSAARRPTQAQVAGQLSAKCLLFLFGVVNRYDKIQVPHFRSQVLQISRVPNLSTGA